MSRILVKNLPPTLKLKDFKTHFSQTSGLEGSLDLTDAKLVHKKDGTFRRFGFVGYKTSSEAKKALDWFNGTYFGSCKVQVEIIEDGLKAERPAKRARVETEELKPDPKRNSKNSNPHADDPLFKEYFEVMSKSRKNMPIWADPVSHPGTSAPVDPLPSEHDEQSAPEIISDIDWLKSKMARSNISEKEYYQDEENDTPTTKPVAAEPEVVEATEEASQDSQSKQTILSTARLFLRNLAFSATTEELEELFSPFGPIEQVHIPQTAEHKGKGMAYVKFKHAPHACEAFEKLDKTVFQGRLLHILPAVDRQSRSDATKMHGVKDKQLEAKKQVAAKKNTLWDWGTLYMNSDAVASSVATRFGISKGDILQEGDDYGVSNVNPAVKLALAETHIIEETRKFLASQGVHLGAFSGESNGLKGPKSSTTLLIKNIPFGTSEDLLRNMFKTHGEIIRFIIPPSGTIAVIDYDDPVSAGSAIRHLNYARVGNSVMYIERAPLAVWESSEEDREVANRTNTGPKAITIAETPNATDTNISPGTTLFVKNLSFNTTAEALMRSFQTLPEFAYAKVATKPDAKNPGGKLSMGYGFVGFTSVEAAQRAQRSMDGYILDAHKLVVKFAGRGTEDASLDSRTTIGGRQTAKMMVKNLPFEATKKDVRQLFGAYGQLKSVRVPKRFDSRSRGFAFLEFVSRQEAERVYNALKHTHLLGRHLVLEWADDESQDIEKLREKVGIGYGEGKALPGRKRKLNMETGEESNEE